MLEVRTFGGFSLREDGRLMGGLGSKKAEALLVYLMVERRQHTRDSLAALLWPESNEQHASTSLRVVLSVFRKHLLEYLDICRDTVGIKTDASAYSDVNDLEQKLAVGKIEQALQLYRGDFLQGFQIQESAEFENWLQWQQEHLRLLMTGALHRAITRAIEAREYVRGRTLIQRLLEIEPIDERAYYQSILLYGIEGERTAALTQYETCCETLQNELGVKPSEELQELHGWILRGDKPSYFIPSLPDSNLPAPQTSFVGREAELAEIGALIQDPDWRLLTLVGPGGSGKTRLAIQAAGEALRCFPDGVYFVPLESADSQDYLIPAIARALQFTLDSLINGADLRTQILDYLVKKSILLVLDGCERIGGTTGDLPAILEKAPNVRVLATSRQRLELRSERVFQIEGLSVPQAAEEMHSDDAEAVRLFRERAKQAGASPQSSGADAEAVECICRMVVGMPLGIELAAAWTSILSPSEIAEATSKSFDFLSTTMVDISERHRSMRAVFESSWMLLTGELQEAFSKVAIFRSGFFLKAAQEVAGVDLERLSALMNRSLVHRSQAGRFAIHSLLQQYAAEKLGEQQALEKEIQGRYCNYFVNMVIQREKDLMGPGMLQVRDEIRIEMDNIRAAVSWAALHWSEIDARKMLISLMCFYAIHGWQEGMIAFRDIAQIRKDAVIAGGVVDLSTDHVFLSARIHQAFLQSNLGLITESEAISRECLEGLRQPGMESELSVCLHNLGVNASYRGEYVDSQDLLEEAIVLGRENNHAMWPTYLFWLGNLYFQLGGYEQGLLTLKKSYNIFDQQGTLWGTAFALSKIAMAEDGLGEHTRAKQHHKDALAEFDRLESKAGQAYALSRMSMSAYFLEQYSEAAQLAKQGYGAFAEIGHRWGMCTSLCGMGFANIGLDEIEMAKVCFIDALKESKPDQIAPQSLYALIGLACCMAQEGKEQKALEIIRLVRKHPETPSIYFEQAVRWIGDCEQASMRYIKQLAVECDEVDTLDAVIRGLFDESTETK